MILESDLPVTAFLLFDSRVKHWRAGLSAVPLDQPVTLTIDPDKLQLDIDADGYTPAQGDCNDYDPTINPGAVEILGDGIDNNCNGLTEE